MFIHCTPMISTVALPTASPYMALALITLPTHHCSLICINIPDSLYIPNLPCNLISPQWLISELQKQNKNLHFTYFLIGVSSLSIPTSSLSNITWHLTFLHSPYTMLCPLKAYHPHHNWHPFIWQHGFAAHSHQTTTPPPFKTTAKQLDNLTAIQHQLYHWHIHLGHMNFTAIQSMAHKNLGIPQDLARCLPLFVKNVFLVKPNDALFKIHSPLANNLYNQERYVV